MRRRLTVAIAGTVLAALALVGLGTLALVQRDARAETERRLKREAVAVGRSRAIAILEPAVLRDALRLADTALVRIGAGCGTQRLDAFNLPDEVAGRVRTSGPLQLGHPISGTEGSLAFAAAPVAHCPRSVAVVLTRQVTTGLGNTVAWFLVACALALVAAAAVAALLARRLVGPLRAVQAAARRIAGGDLAARVPADRSGQDELAQLARSVNTMAEALERSRNLERQFLLSVSHDLRTPLTSIRGFAEAIAEGAAEDNEKAASVIGAEARRLERLVTDLLLLAKLDARQFGLDIGPCDVSGVVDDASGAFRPAARELGVTVTTQVEPDLEALADPDRLGQVVANLVENALKFAATAVVVEASRAPDGLVEVRVSDDGPGIHPDDAGRIFDRLYASARTPARAVGSGLGLAIVRELADAMGASVTVGPGDGGGATMTVRLVSSRPADAPSSSSSSSGEQSSSSSGEQSSSSPFSARPAPAP